MLVMLGHFLNESKGIRILQDHVLPSNMRRARSLES
jgi:hypothetical protein